MEVNSQLHSLAGLLCRKSFRYSLSDDRVGVKTVWTRPFKRMFTLPVGEPRFSCHPVRRLVKVMNKLLGSSLQSPSRGILNTLMYPTGMAGHTQGEIAATSDQR